MTSRPSFFIQRAILPMVVVLPAPLMPTTSSTNGRLFPSSISSGSSIGLSKDDHVCAGARTGPAHRRTRAPACVWRRLSINSVVAWHADICRQQARFELVQQIFVEARVREQRADLAPEQAAAQPFAPAESLPSGSGAAMGCADRHGRRWRGSGLRLKNRNIGSPWIAKNASRESCDLIRAACPVPRLVQTRGGLASHGVVGCTSAMAIGPVVVHAGPRSGGECRQQISVDSMNSRADHRRKPGAPGSKLGDEVVASPTLSVARANPRVQLARAGDRGRRRARARSVQPELLACLGIEEDCRAVPREADFVESRSGWTRAAALRATLTRTQASGPRVLDARRARRARRRGVVARSGRSGVRRIRPSLAGGL